jgi:hypothetical protein
MFKIITSQSVTAVAAAAFLAGMAVLLTSVAPPAQAGGLVSEPVAKANSLAFVITAGACSARGWPNYDQACLRGSVSELRQVRVINLETHRLQAGAD